MNLYRKHLVEICLQDWQLFSPLSCESDCISGFGAPGFSCYSADKILQEQWLLCIVGWHMLLFFFKRMDACQVLKGISGGHQSRKTPYSRNGTTIFKITVQQNQTKGKVNFQTPFSIWSLLPSRLLLEQNPNTNPGGIVVINYYRAALCVTTDTRDSDDYQLSWSTTIFRKLKLFCVRGRQCGNLVG